MDAEANERLKLLKGGLDEASARLRTGLFTFVSASLYLAVTAAATTHRDLLLGRLYNLPIFDVGLPIVGFYLLAPIVYVVLHGTVLAQTYTVARRATALAEAAPPEADGRGAALPADPGSVMRLVLPAVASAGGRGRWPRILFVLALMLAVLVVLPLAVLALLHWKFLAYQDEIISAAHAALIAGDAALVLCFAVALPGPSAGDRAAAPATGGAPARPRFRWSPALALPAVGLLLAAGWLAYPATLPDSRSPLRLSLANEAIAADPLGNGRTVDDDAIKERLAVFEPGGPALSLPDIMRRAERAAIRLPARLDLRGRDLRGADLFGARLTGADLSCADLTEADLRHADLRGAVLRGARLRRAGLDFAQLQLADLTNADLRGASANLARFEGATVYNADFTRAELAGAHLQFLRYSHPLPKGDVLGRRPAAAEADEPAAEAGRAAAAAAEDDEAPCRREGSSSSLPPVLAGTVLRGAQLQGSSLKDVDLRGADLTEAQLDGLDVREARIEGAVLTGAVAAAPGRPDRLIRLDREGREAADACSGGVDFRTLYFDAALTVDGPSLFATLGAVDTLKTLEAACPRGGKGRQRVAGAAMGAAGP